jgi:hypothetical protein
VAGSAEIVNTATTEHEVLVERSIPDGYYSWPVMTVRSHRRKVQLDQFSENGYVGKSLAVTDTFTDVTGGIFMPLWADPVPILRTTSHVSMENEIMRKIIQLFVLCLALASCSTRSFAQKPWPYDPSLQPITRQEMIRIIHSPKAQPANHQRLLSRAADPDCWNTPLPNTTKLEGKATRPSAAKRIWFCLFPTKVHPLQTYQQSPPRQAS